MKRYTVLTLAVVLAASGCTNQKEEEAKPDIKTVEGADYSAVIEQGARTLSAVDIDILTQVVDPASTSQAAIEPLNKALLAQDPTLKAKVTGISDKPRGIECVSFENKTMTLMGEDTEFLLSFTDGTTCSKSTDSDVFTVKVTQNPEGGFVATLQDEDVRGVSVQLELIRTLFNQGAFPNYKMS